MPVASATAPAPSTTADVGHPGWRLRLRWQPADALGVCGGSCTADADADGICDDVDDCIGVVDECGICNGPGATGIAGATTSPRRL